MKKIYTVIILIASISNAWAFVDCPRPVSKVWSGDVTNRIAVLHSDSFQSSLMTLEYVNNDDKVIDRVLSVILSGAMGGKTITFRYSAGTDGSPASCTPTVPQKLIGAWVSF